jgi:hypothetical protein
LLVAVAIIAKEIKNMAIVKIGCVGNENVWKMYVRSATKTFGVSAGLDIRYSTNNAFSFLKQRTSQEPFKDREECHVLSERQIPESSEEEDWIPSPLKARKQKVTPLKPGRV